MRYNKNIILTLLILIICSITAYSQTISVIDFGAKGDGITDDTDAFRKAITSAEKENKDVTVPKGIYVISDSIKLNKTALIGSTNSAWPSDEITMPVIKATGLKNPTIIMDQGSAVTGFFFRYDQNYDKPIKFPDTINIIGTGCWIRNIKIHGAYKGIVAEGSLKENGKNPGRLNIENVFMVNIVNTGVYVNGTRDISLLENIEVWSPNVDLNRDRPVGFHMKSNDGLKMSNCFSFALQIGFLFEHSAKADEYLTGAFWGTMTDCMADFCGEGIVIKCLDTKQEPKKEDYHSTLTVNGGTFWAHGNSVRIEGCCFAFQMSSADMRANGGNNIIINGGKNIAITNCRISKEMKEHPNANIIVSGGENVSITNNIISGTNDGVIINSGFKKIMISNNIINTPNGKAIVDNTITGKSLVERYKSSKTKIIKDNL